MQPQVRSEIERQRSIPTWHLPRDRVFKTPESHILPKVGPTQKEASGTLEELKDPDLDGFSCRALEKMTGPVLGRIAEEGIPLH
jgi:hypothetical protein